MAEILEHRLDRLEKICDALAAAHCWLDMELEYLLDALRDLLAESDIALDDYLKEVKDTYCPKCYGNMIRRKGVFRCLDCGFFSGGIVDSFEEP